MLATAEMVAGMNGAFSMMDESIEVANLIKDGADGQFDSPASRETVDKARKAWITLEGFLRAAGAI